MRGERIQIPQKRAVNSETPFDGLGSSREHKCENSLNFSGIAMGLYRGWRGGGGGAMSSLDPRMHKDCAFVCVC